MRCHGSRLLPVLVCAALVALAPWPTRAWATGVHVRVEARVGPGGRQLDGTVTVEYDSTCPTSTAPATLVVAPARLASPPQVGGDLLLRRVYPRGFDGAAMRVWGADGARATSAASPAGWPEGTVVQVPRDEATGEARATFELDVPHRFGRFGFANDQLTLEGGWFPYPAGPCPEEAPSAAPPPGETTLTVTLPPGWSAALGSGFHPASAGPVAQARRPATAQIPLIAGPRLAPVPTPEAPDARLYASRVGSRQRRGLTAGLALALQAARDRGLPPAEPLTVVLIPDRRALVTPGDGVLLLSDRLLSVHPLARRLHTPALVEGALAVGARQALRAGGTVADEDVGWIADAAAFRLFPLWAEDAGHGAVDVAALIRPLAFLPAFDSLLYAPRFPFADEVYGAVFRIDPLAEDVASLHHPMAAGRAVLVKLADRYGLDAVDAGLLAALTGGDLARALGDAAGVPAEEVRTFIGGYTRTWPREDLRLAAPSGPGEGTWQTWEGVEPREGRAVAVERVGEGPLPEEVIDVAAGRELVVRWTAPAVGTPGPVAQRSPPVMLPAPRLGAPVEIDPMRHTLQLRDDGLVLRGDDRQPAAWKAIFGGTLSNVSPSDLQATFDLGLSLMPRYDRRHLVLLDVLSDDVRLGAVAAGYFRYLGPARDAVWRRHRAGMLLTGSALRDGADPLAALPAVGASLSYRFESRSDLFDPRRGGRLGLMVEGGRVLDARLAVDPTSGILGSAPATGGWYGAVSGQAVGLVPAGRLGVVAGALRGAWEAGEVAPPLPLGGGTNVRGLGADAATDRGRIVASTELRLDLAPDVDLDLGLWHLRRLQGVLLADGGLSGGDAPARGGAGAGAGLRAHLDALGLVPGLLGVDVAWGGLMGEGPPPARPSVYLRFTQAF